MIGAREDAGQQRMRPRSPSGVGPPELRQLGTYHWMHWPSAWPAADISAPHLARLPVQEIVVATDGSTSAIERARTVLANTYPDRDIPWTVREDHAQSGAQLAGYSNWPTWSSWSVSPSPAAAWR